MPAAVGWSRCSGPAEVLAVRLSSGALQCCVKQLAASVRRTLDQRVLGGGRVIPVGLWFLAKNKAADAQCGFRDRCNRSERLTSSEGNWQQNFSLN